MKIMFLLLFVCLLSLFSFTGCQSAQQTHQVNQYTCNDIEMSLIRDINDGHLDMPLDRACLIASGVHNNRKIQTYQKKIDLLILQITKETSVNNVNGHIEKAKIIFDWLKENASEGSYRNCYDFKDTLNIKVGNCLSYAIRFTILCRHFDIDIKNIFVPGHIYNMVSDNDHEHLFEHTHSDGIVKKKDRYHPQRKIMKNIELVGEIFLYKARNNNTNADYDMSVKFCEQAMLCNPEDNRPMILLLDNYIAKKEYEIAFIHLDKYLAQHPDDKTFFNKTYILLKKLCDKKGQKPLVY
ncbi:MAG: transglutaminase domain-containing protein [Candidatus Kuenenia sp.]|nr:transglutaminase domain-containing protein [Candidatus Kuenenia hertensis]